jgi:hypothetical protein
MNTNSNKYSKTEILQLLLKYSPFWAIYFRVNPLPEDIEKIASLMSMLFGKESVPKKPYK